MRIWEWLIEELYYSFRTHKKTHTPKGVGLYIHTICFSDIGSLIHAHAAHVTTHSSTRRHCRHLLLLFGLFNDCGLGSQEQ